MNISISREPKLQKVDNLFVLLAEGARATGLDGPLQKKVAEAISKSGFSGRQDEGVTLLLDGEPKKLTLVGIGKETGFNRRVARAVLQGVARIARRNRERTIALHCPYLLPGSDAESTAEFLLDRLAHADYRYIDFKTGDEAKKFEIDCTLIPAGDLDNKTARKVLQKAKVIADSVRVVRDLGNSPANLMTPTRLGERAREVAREAGFDCSILDRKAIEKLGMGGLLAVNRGSAEEPRFIVLEWSPRKAKKTVVLVGKGITFDSGGISIKPAEKMEEMKFDMSGAGAVIGILRAAAMLELPVRVIGLIPATENLPSGTAYKPGDIIRTMSGKTVEIVNTDAEGRMVLCDAIHYSARYEPDHLIDFATLTGACVVALGYEASGLFSNDDQLAQLLIEASESVGEPVWRLPEWDDYKEYIRSEWADMKNSGGRWGGAVTAALFLKQFVQCPSWAHVDIAGTAYTESENARDPRGATGSGVRMAIRFLESLQ